MRLPLLALAFSLLLPACPEKKGSSGPDASASSASIACYTDVQFRCKELPRPTAAQREALAVECSSGSGALSSPALCPTAKFVGKCTVPPEGASGEEVRRWYTQDDAAYQKDFCINTAKGVWSTTF